MKKYILFIAAVCALFLCGSCSKDNNSSLPNPVSTYKATLNGGSVVTPINTMASGNATASYNSDTKVLSVTLNSAGLVAISAHIHKGTAGMSGPILYAFAAPYNSQIYLTTLPLELSQEADLFANGLYIDVHSDSYPNGEIRGQLIKQ